MTKKEMSTLMWFTHLEKIDGGKLIKCLWRSIMKRPAGRLKKSGLSQVIVSGGKEFELAQLRGTVKNRSE